LEHEAVDEAVAFGIPAPTPEFPNDSNIHMVVVLHHNSRRHVTEAVLLKHLKSVLPETKIPEKIHIVDSIPKTPTGKLLRASVAQQFTNVAKKASATKSKL
jgi:fatty-acyl-CoA synthase